MSEAIETAPPQSDEATKNLAKEDQPTRSTTAPAPRRIIRRRRRAKKQQDEEDVVDPILLQKVIQESALPKDYNFEIIKSVRRIKQLNATHVALQMPEGLLLYATVLADVFQRLVPTLQHVSVLGDVTYGACCVDDLGAKALGAQLLLHYGHSCLVPLQHTAVPCLYVFVEIRIDVQHLVDCVCETIPESTPVCLLGTVQFRNALVEAAPIFNERNRPSVIPQAKPLSPGEVLGCTSPKLDAYPNSVVVFCADGRFHLESTMISNPNHKFLRYDPYSKLLTVEKYDTIKMKSIRHDAIQKARNAKIFGVVLGTLGRQGNPAILQNIRSLLTKHNKRSFIMLLSEVTPAKLSSIPKPDAWVQIACPRLSVDWGHFFNVPVLSSYELHVCLEETEWNTKDNSYPMDFYSQAGGPWSNYHGTNKDRQCQVVP
mmetsp:Transcript_6402/g.9061  ORF Transcript_6402/g.9061 Transcript_6402/m.9061 type:complete len:429 (-) Transcript_6402:385-1671(-)